MNTTVNILEQFRNDEARVLDRLVDGEMSPQDRRTLLAGLDDEPGAWRRCALAFLEAQSWRAQLSRVAAEPLIASQPVSQSAVSSSERQRLRSYLAIAASLCAAFGLGMRFPLASNGSPEVAVRATDTAAISKTPAIESPASQPAEDDAQESGSEDDGSGYQMLTLTPDGETDPSGSIQVRVNKPGSSERPSATAPFSLGVSQPFEAAGWQVDRQQSVIPIELTDGRRVMVPVEQYDLRQPESRQF